MEANQKHILSEEDRVLELMERGSLADKAALDALRDDEQLRRACMDVLELTSCCRRREEKPDVEAALRRFHQQHGGHRVALMPRSSRRRWWAVAAAVLVLVGVSALLLPQLSRQTPLAEQSATQALSPTCASCRRRAEGTCRHGVGIQAGRSRRTAEGCGGSARENAHRQGWSRRKQCRDVARRQSRVSLSTKQFEAFLRALRAKSVA